MATTPAPNPRASLLAGLRTGGVRSSSNPASAFPHSAAPGVSSFNMPRYASVTLNGNHFPPEDEEDELADMFSQNFYINGVNARTQHQQQQQPPRTSAVDGPSNRFSQQQTGGQMGMHGGMPLSAAAYGMQGVQAQAQAQAQQLQLQMMQMEIVRLQALQAQQQYQAGLLAQAQQQQQFQAGRRPSASFNPPMTAGPVNGSFDVRTAAAHAQLRRASQAEQLKVHLGLPGSDEPAPLSAGPGGKFGSRLAPVNTSRLGVDDEDFANGGLSVPPTPSRTTVISGGTSLGGSTATGQGNEGTSPSGPSKSDSAVSWRRSGANNSVLNGNNRTTSMSISPSVKITPPPGERVSPPPVHTKARPQPLRFSVAISQPLPAVTIDTADGTDGDDGETSSFGSSRSGSPQSSPNTPPSSGISQPPLSPREEASKKLYEGLGIGRPAPTPQIQGVAGVPQQQQQQPTTVAGYRLASQPMRQPRGPPSGADELGPKNFATRIRRKAIGGLGMLMGARERREFVEVY
ncbi:hypothetical protein JAAARDRAFT_43707 [Jaapia argillacea MUCL 33604]|uniref:Uncharacterized protein n=1 Tax=Jaapia argillacea MUCL 33604 TaxID=933084 RepID=A0A067QF69_9AGAM|nr:hypothetical protein JAAARDRAFT_43707 [Jaapia argillacea MUCL 33604]